jgi:hypothetical protein
MVAGAVRRKAMTVSDLRRFGEEGIHLALAHHRDRKTTTSIDDARETAGWSQRTPTQRSEVMSTQTNVAVNAARKAVYDKVESQIHTFEAQLATLKAKADSAKADAELKAIASLVTAKRTLDQKVAELKNAGEAAFQQAKADVEARIAEFDKSVKAIESKIKAS